MELYLDANAHLPASRIALKTFSDFQASKAGHGNASSPSAPGRAASLAIEEARAKIAQLLGATDPGQIVFTSSCTQACEWAINILSDYWWDKGHDYYISPTEHAAINLPAIELCRSFDPYLESVELKEIPINKDGIIENFDYSDNPVICIYVQNETGIIQPIQNIMAAHLVSDMSQAPGKILFKLSELPVDFATFGAHKFGGIENLGFLYIKDSSNWKEFGTGSRYYRDRTGTISAASIVASAVALEEAINTFYERQAKMIEFQSILEYGLMNLGVEIIAKDAERVKNTTFIKLGDGKGLQALTGLGEQGIHVALGSACSGLVSKSPLMEKMGISGSAHDFLRISQWGEYGAKEAKYILDKIIKYI